jgi:DNA-binding response OmpR family regulator
MPRILVVEDEAKLRDALKRGLAEAGYDVVAASDGDEGLQHAASKTFDCLVLDVMLPKRSGLDILSELRAAGVTTPTLILSARGAVEDCVLGLDHGADDYLAKPFAWAELLARVRACLRRGNTGQGAMLRAGGVELDPILRRLVQGDREVELTSRETDLLGYLMRRAGQTVSREMLARDVWCDPQAGLTNVIDVYVNYLRKKLDKVGAGGLIETIRGIGYVLRG